MAIDTHLAQHHELQAQYQSMTAGILGTAPQAIARARLVVYAWFTRQILGETMDRDLGRFLQRIGVFLR